MTIGRSGFTNQLDRESIRHVRVVDAITQDLQVVARQRFRRIDKNPFDAREPVDRANGKNFLNC